MTTGYKKNGGSSSRGRVAAGKEPLDNVAVVLQTVFPQKAYVTSLM